MAHLVEPSGRVTVRVELDLNLSPAQQRAGRPISDPQCNPPVAESARPDEQAVHNKGGCTETSAPGERNEASQSDALLSTEGGDEEHVLGEEEEGAPVVPPEDISQPLLTAPGSPDRSSEAEDMDMQAAVSSPQQPTDPSNTTSDSLPEISCDGPSDLDGSDEGEAPGEDLYQHWAQKLEQQRVQRTGHARQGGATFRCAMCTSGRGKLRVFPHLAALIRHAETVTSGPRTAAHVAYARALSELEEKLGEGRAGKKLAKLSDPEKVVVPPVVFAQNLRTKFDQERGQWNGLSEKVLEKSFRAKGYEFEKISRSGMSRATGGSRWFSSRRQRAACCAPSSWTRARSGRGAVALRGSARGTLASARSSPMAAHKSSVTWQRCATCAGSIQTEGWAGGRRRSRRSCSVPFGSGTNGRNSS